VRNDFEESAPIKMVQLVRAPLLRNAIRVAVDFRHAGSWDVARILRNDAVLMLGGHPYRFVRSKTNKSFSGVLDAGAWPDGGSDTSANALFGSLPRITRNNCNLDPILMTPPTVPEA